MTGETFEYAIKKDVRNNPIVREVDRERHRDMWRAVATGTFLVAVLLFSAWQHFELLRHGYRLEQMQKERAAQEEINRHLRLEIETLKSPARIERLATARLRMIPPGPDDATIIERVMPGGAAAAFRRGTPLASNGVPVADKPIIDWRRTLRRRLAIAAAVMLLWAGAIEARLVYLQVFQNAELVSRAERQQMHTVASPAKRGEILDRKGHILAYSVDTETIYADPREVDDPARATARLCGALGDCSGDDRKQLLERLSSRKGFAYVRRQVSPQQARNVAALEQEGVGFVKENRRFYPNKDLAAQVLGYVGLDNTGLAGIEAAYDSLIKGKPGKVLVQIDAKRQAFSRMERPATGGASLELTIDEYLQHVVERELRADVEENRAAGATAVVMDPWTGEILAMASYPTFNPNIYQQADVKHRRNRAVQDVYEPGSTFKVVTASAALEQKIVKPDDMINASGGSIRFGSRLIRDTHDYGVLSFTDVIVKSSNVGAIRVGLKLGAKRMSDYVRRFGFGRRASPDFPGETPGIVWSPDKLSDSALASVSMGYQVAVTPLQMAAAVSSVANGGELLEPRVVRAVIRDGKRIPVPHKVVNRTVTPDIAAEMTTIMESVVDRGTATMAQIPGYTIAGKTGTAAKLVGGRYSRSDYNGSFVGFLPSQKPVFTIVVVTDSAHGKNGYYGGPVSGPVFKRIAEAALRYYGVPPTLNAPPPLLLARTGGADQQPTAAEPQAPAILAMASATSSGTPVFPDLTGMSARDAVRLLSRLGVTAKLHGTGLVSEQRPVAGSPLDAGADVALWLQRDPTVQLVSDTPQ